MKKCLVLFFSSVCRYPRRCYVHTEGQRFSHYKPVSQYLHVQQHCPLEGTSSAWLIGYFSILTKFLLIDMGYTCCEQGETSCVSTGQEANYGTRVSGVFALASERMQPLLSVFSDLFPK